MDQLERLVDWDLGRRCPPLGSPRCAPITGTSSSSRQGSSRWFTTESEDIVDCTRAGFLYIPSVSTGILR